MKTRKSLSAVLFFLGAMISSTAQTDTKLDSLALELQNPVANLIQLPVNTDYTYGYDPFDGNQMLISVEPVVPMILSENWNVVFRLVAPFVTQSDVTSDGDSETGLRDFTLSAFFVPKSKGLIVGFGPIITLPTATENVLGAGKWSLGPTLATLIQTTSTTVGVLLNQSWSVTGNSNRADVSSTLVQPFFAQNFGKGWAVQVSAQTVLDWKNDSTNGKATPVAQKLVNFGKIPIRFGAGPVIPFGNGNLAEFGLRLAITASL
ncbi:MAG: hypothetical protein AAGC43_18425 [Bacteroidota bacterium]